MEATTSLRRTEIVDLLNSSEVNQEVCIKGWVRHFRSNRFLILNDGSTINTIQVVVDTDNTNEDIIKKLTVGASVSIIGTLVESQGKGQNREVQGKEIEILGEADVNEYPLQPKKHSMEFLREIAHLRPRTNTFSAVYRVRHALSHAVHKFFNDKGFYVMHTPIITASDAEGAGETFKVTTFDAKNPSLNEDGSVNYKEDFFGKETNLTVSGQLEAELGALGLGKVYTFGPTFRAENSNTSRHLAEFWMIEPEVAFNDLTDNMDLTEEFIKYCLTYVLENCKDDMDFLNDRFAKEEQGKPQAQRSEWGLIEKLEFVTRNDFERLTYTEAIEILMNSKPQKKKKFKYLVEGFGTDLQSEHERYLVEKHFKKPVILTDYPAEIKAFYMRMNDDGKTVAAMDVLVPGIGELVGGSQREERYDMLVEAMKRFNIEEDEMWWYLETRKFGTVPHSGFGLGFERLVQFATGMGNIRDVIPFPRTPQNAEF